MRLDLGQPLDMLLENAREPTVVGRIEGEIVGANAAACRLFGYELEEILALNRRDISAPEDSRLGAAMTERERNGRATSRLVLMRKGGERFETELRTFVFEGPGREPLLWLTMRDLTELRRAEAAEEQFRALSEATFDAVFLHRDGIILLANAAAEQQYRVPAGELVGKPLADFIAPDSREFVAQMGRAQEPGPYEAKGLRADGSVFPAEVRARHATFRGEKVRVVSVRDLTARKQMESELAVADRLATIGTLAAGIAHDINNPLTFVLLGVESVIGEIAKSGVPREGPANSRVLRTLRDAHAGAGRVRDIVKDLLAFSREDEQYGSVQLERVIAYATRMTQVEIKHRARLFVHIDRVPPVLASETRLGQVVVNLLVNAAQSIPEGAALDNRIDVTVNLDPGGLVALSVRDTGAGIAPAMLDRIFEPFVTTKAQGLGTGLGLSICHGIVTRLGGRIEVESALGKGSTFRVLLPTAAEQTVPAVAETEPNALSRVRRARVLVVDDEPRLRSMLQQILGVEHEVLTAASGREALELLAAQAAFDVILCDLMMPDLTGMDVHEQIEERDPSLARRMIFLTGGVFSGRAEAFVAAHAERTLAKPFSAAALEARIATMLTR